MDHLRKPSRPSKGKEDLIALQDHELAQTQDNPDDPDPVDPVSADPDRNRSLPAPNPNPDHSRKDLEEEKRNAHSDDALKNVLGSGGATHRPEECNTQHGRRNYPEILGTGEAWHADLDFGEFTWQHLPFPTAQTDVAGSRTSQPPATQISTQYPPREGRLHIQVSQPSSPYRPSQNVASSLPPSTAVDVGSIYQERPQSLEYPMDNSRGPPDSLVVLNIIASFLSMFCCLCTGLAAFIVAIQACRQKRAGRPQEATQRLWCSLALVIASIFILIPTLLLFLLRALH
ncbi:hypothetical protein ACOMHN_061815 [Nucella lapillus]